MTTWEIILLLAFPAAMVLARQPGGQGWRALGLRALPLLLLVLIAATGNWRWQLAPVAFAAIFLILHSMAKGGFARVTSMGATSVFFLIGAALLWALPVYEPPLPQGPYAIGVRYMELVDRSRLDENTEASDDHRRLMVSIWYPASPGPDAEPSPYLPDAFATSPSYAAKIGWPAFTTGHLRLFRSHAYLNAPPKEEDGAFPLIIYSHGLSNDRFEATARIEQLVSRGFVVLSIGHTYGTHMTRFPDGEVTRFINFRTAGMDADGVDAIRITRAELWLEDARFALGELREQSDIPVDFDKIGYMGFSAGGTAATLALYQWDDIDAAINLDGTPRGAVVGQVLSKPALFLQSEPPTVSDEQLKAWGVNREDFWDGIFRVGNRMQDLTMKSEAFAEHWILKGSKHSNFTDFPSWTPVSAWVGIGGEVDSFDAMCAIDDKVIRFFSRYLKSGAEQASCSYPAELWRAP